MKTCALCGLVEGSGKPFFTVKVGWLTDWQLVKLPKDDRERPWLYIIACKDCCEGMEPDDL